MGDAVCLSVCLPSPAVGQSCGWKLFGPLVPVQPRLHPLIRSAGGHWAGYTTSCSTSISGMQRGQSLHPNNGKGLGRRRVQGAPGHRHWVAGVQEMSPWASPQGNRGLLEETAISHGMMTSGNVLGQGVPAETPACGPCGRGRGQALDVQAPALHRAAPRGLCVEGQVL